VTILAWSERLQSKWQEKRLKYIAPLSTNRAEEVTDNQLYLGLENIESWTGRLINVNTKAETNEESEEGFGTSGVFKKGNVLFGKLRPYLAKVYLAEQQGFCTTELLVMQPSSKLEPRFLQYVLLSPEFIKTVDSSTFGARMPRANWEFIGNILIPTPPLETQQRIADYLDRETAQIDALIEAKEQMLGLLEEKRAALVSRAVTKGLNHDVPMKDSGLEWLGEIPAHWELRRLKFFVSKIEQGWSPQCDNFPADPDFWGVLKVGAVNGWEFNPEENKTLPDDLEPLTEYEIKSGDILMSRANTTQLVGQAVIVKDVRPKLILCDKLYRLRIDRENLDGEFLVRYLGTRPGRFEFERDASGASNSMQNIGQDSVMNLWLPVPSRQEQQSIVKYIHNEVNEANLTIEEILTSIKLLKERRSALITAAVTGQLQEVLA
jgi:type I restriction enzyme, S subunit